MARLSAHGTELDRREYGNCRVAVMSDGQIMRNTGAGWKLWKRLKPGVNPQEYAERKRREYLARPAEFHNLIAALIQATSLEHRAHLATLVDLMSTDGDGVYSEFNDSVYGYQVDLEDCWRCCRAMQALDAWMKAQPDPAERTAAA